MQNKDFLVFRSVRPCKNLHLLATPEKSIGQGEAGALSPLFVPVPSNLAGLLGYTRDARYVALFWSHEADEVILTDGVGRGVGESLRFLEYCGHPAVESELGDLNIGLFDEPATAWLVLDQHGGNLYYATTEAARAFLAQQHASDVVDTGRIQLRDDAIVVLEEYDPALDDLRAYLEKFVEPNDRE
jgi:hypothetical protein